MNTISFFREVCLCLIMSQHHLTDQLSLSVGCGICISRSPRAPVGNLGHYGMEFHTTPQTHSVAFQHTKSHQYEWGWYQILPSFVPSSSAFLETGKGKNTPRQFLGSFWNHERTLAPMGPLGHTRPQEASSPTSCSKIGHCKATSRCSDLYPVRFEKLQELPEASLGTML